MVVRARLAPYASAVPIAIARWHGEHQGIIIIGPNNRLTTVSDFLVNSSDLLHTRTRLVHLVVNVTLG